MKIVHAILIIGLFSVCIVSAGTFDIPQPPSAENLSCEYAQIVGDLDNDGSYDAVLIYGDSTSAKVLQVYSLGKAKDLHVGALSIKSKSRFVKNSSYIDYRNIVSWKDLDNDGVTELIVGNKLYTFYSSFSRPWKQ